MIARVSTALIMLFLLAGCSSAPLEQLAPTPVSTPIPAPTAEISVPVQGSEVTPPVESSPPVRIQVPSVQIDISIQPVGVGDDGEMAIPKDITIGGWYQYGSSPGSPVGSTVITAHVDAFDQGLGPFAYLKEMPADAEVIVTTADGVDHRYVVASVQNVEKKQLPLDQVFDRAGAPRLVLITCGGQFDQNVLNYSDNVIAIANPA